MQKKQLGGTLAGKGKRETRSFKVSCFCPSSLIMNEHSEQRWFCIGIGSVCITGLWLCLLFSNLSLWVGTSLE